MKFWLAFKEYVYFSLHSATFAHSIVVAIGIQVTVAQRSLHKIADVLKLQPSKYQLRCLVAERASWINLKAKNKEW